MVKKFPARAELQHQIEVLLILKVVKELQDVGVTEGALYADFTLKALKQGAGAQLVLLHDFECVLASVDPVLYTVNVAGGTTTQRLDDLVVLCGGILRDLTRTLLPF